MLHYLIPQEFSIIARYVMYGLVQKSWMFFPRKMFHSCYPKPHWGGHHVQGGNERTSSLLSYVFFFSSLGIIHWRMDCLHECCTTSQKGAVISARTSRCYCNTINNKMSPMPKQKKDENNISKIRNLLLVVENMLSCGSSQRRKNFLKPYPSQKLSFDEGKMQEIDAWFCFSFFNSAGYQPTKDLWELERKTECGNNARHG